MHIVEDIEITKGKDGKFGLKNNLKGKIILDPIYDNIEKWEHSDSYYFPSGNDNEPEIPDMFIIIKDDKIGFADENGITVEPIYDNILTEDFLYQEKLYPVFVAIIDEHYGYIDMYGKPLTQFIYDDVDFPLVSPIAHVLNKNGMDEYISLTSGKTFFSSPTSKDITASITQAHVAFLIESKRYKVFDKDGNCVADFLNNNKLNSSPIRYLNEKLLMYFDITDIKSSLYKIGLIDHTGKILTDIKYSEVKAIQGTTTVLCRNLVGNLMELVNSKGEVVLTRMKNAISWTGVNGENRLIPPISYWNEDDDPTDVDKCIEVDNVLLEKE